MRLNMILSALVFSVAWLSLSAAPVKIVAALPDLGSIASYIGGDRVEVTAISGALSNPHSVEVFPSYMARVSKADIYLKSGLGLDQWSDAIIDGSRSNRITVIDCSKGISVLEKPAGKVDASLGDVHQSGNPHYWLDPRNGTVIAGNICTGLQKVDPVNEAYYSIRLEQFSNDCSERFCAWKEKLKPLNGFKIITYHSSWVYFCDAFGFSIIAKVEPFPGIPPSGKHLADLVNSIKTCHVAFIIQEPYFSDDGPNFLFRQTGIRIFKLAPSCPEVSASSYFSNFDSIVSQLISAPGGI